ncbi:hypothetical protein FCK90_01705 [Kocuria coralli]|uniref:Uncharacterized protein n=1 Tax=Kocuria coralli TaxID=1461025 RepID=A0A5J5L2G1_9MICC|nr:hypothetical protein [Kocuria coralli]KAA9395738.1 hypothetical protein FCK90_01705 [Kocuria coralli]
MTKPRRPRPVRFHDDAPGEGERLFSDGTISPVLRTDFDVSAYTHDVAGPIPIDTESLRATARNDAETAALHRNLTYLHRVEAAALTETRTMYSSWTANEARITAFIASWLWERFWWARGLREIRDALPAPSPPVSPERRTGPLPALRAGIRRTYAKRALPIAGPGWTAAFGERVTAGHMARMALQEASLQAALRILRPRLQGLPEAQRVVGEIMDRRERSLDFFRQEAIARISRSRAEALTARLVVAVGGDPLRPAGRRIPGEQSARADLFQAPADRAVLSEAQTGITRFLPGPDRMVTIIPATAARGARPVSGGFLGVRS